MIGVDRSGAALDGTVALRSSIARVADTPNVQQSGSQLRVEWSLQAGTRRGDAVQTFVSWTRSSEVVEWVAWSPPTHSAAVFPELPPLAVEYAPSSNIGPVELKHLDALTAEDYVDSCPTCHRAGSTTRIGAGSVRERRPHSEATLAQRAAGIARVVPRPGSLPHPVPVSAAR